MGERFEALSFVVIKQTAHRMLNCIGLGFSRVRVIVAPCKMHLTQDFPCQITKFRVHLSGYMFVFTNILARFRFDFLYQQYRNLIPIFKQSDLVS